jgi:hypothetical protein
MNTEISPQVLESYRQLKRAVYQVLQEWEHLEHEGVMDRESCRVSLETMLRLSRAYEACRS